MIDNVLVRIEGDDNDMVISDFNGGDDALKANFRPNSIGIRGICCNFAIGILYFIKSEHIKARLLYGNDIKSNK